MRRATIWALAAAAIWAWANQTQIDSQTGRVASPAASLGKPYPVQTAKPPVRQTPRTYVTSRAKREGWTGRQMDCLDKLIWAESSWRPDANNPHSTAWGLFQILRTPEGLPLAKQVERGFRYIKHRHGTPCDAWAFHRKHNYY